MKQLILFVIVCTGLLFPRDSEAQLRFLQIETVGKVKTRKFAVGDELTFRIGGEDSWQRAYIEDFRMDEQIILLGNGFVRLPEIGAIRTFDGRERSRLIGTQLYVFGTAWSFFALAGSLAVPDRFNYQASDAIVTASSFAVGFVIRQIFKQKTWKIGKRRRLRLIDLRL